MELKMLLVNKEDNESMIEMPIYKEDFNDYTDLELEEAIKGALGKSAELIFTTGAGLYLEVYGNREYYEYKKALKIGNEYFKLKKI